LLDKKVQNKLFWREIISYVKKTWENETKKENDGSVTLWEIYSPRRRNKKEIIISASWMWDWWAILSHLKENIPNPNSKIISIWYAPKNTRLWRIKSWDDFISIDWEVYELKCEVDDIPGFSGHIDEEEIIMLLTQMEFKKWAILALTHWNEKRFILAEKIQKAMDKVWKKVKIIVPKLWDTINIKI
jgi:predicted metal-dependent RNase